MSYIKERIKHAIRFRHKRGYGVHSPFMFHLILHVIRDKEKQFTYPEDPEFARRLTSREKKLFRLLSRLIRYLKPGRVVCIGKSADLLTEYLSLAYPEASILSNRPEKIREAAFIYLGRESASVLPEEMDWPEVIAVQPRYLLIADIYKNADNARLWRSLREKATVSVDMMWYGLLLFEPKIQRGRYNLIL